MGLWPVGSPYICNITRMQCFGCMHTGVLWVLCMFFDYRIARYRMRTLKGSTRFMCGHRTGSCGFHTSLGIRLCMWASYHKRAWEYPYDQSCRAAGRYRARWGPWGHLRVILPGETWLCAIWPVEVSTTPARRSTGLIPTQNRRKTVRVWKYGARTSPNIFKTLFGPIRHAVWWLPKGPRTARELHVT